MEAEIKAVRKTKDGALLIKMDDNDEKAKEVKEQILKAMDKTDRFDGSVTIARGNSEKNKVIHIRDLDELTTEGEVREAICKNLTTEQTKEVKITSFRPAFGSTKVATIVATKQVASSIIDLKTVKIGLVSCKIKERLNKERCSRCWRPGHKIQACDGPDRSQLCIQCGESGHKIRDCNNKPKCLVCKRKGHTAVSTRCAIIRLELNRLEKAKTPDSNRDS